MQKFSGNRTKPWITLDLQNKPLDKSLFQHGILIEGENVFPPALADAEIIAAAVPQIFTRLQNANFLESRVMEFDKIRRAVSRAIVHHKNLKIRIILRKQSIETFLNVPPAVVAWNNNANQGLHRDSELKTSKLA